MTTVVACRMCLATDIRMYTIVNTPLQRIYEKMTELRLHTDDGRPVMACYLCHHLLKRSEAFIDKSVRADGLLKEILNQGLQITEKSISMIDRTLLGPALDITRPDCVAITTKTITVEVPIKMEQHIVKKERGKEEAEDVDFGQMELDIEYMEPHPRHSLSDSEEDMPLKVLSTKSVRSKVRDSCEELKKQLKNIVPTDLDIGYMESRPDPTHSSSESEDVPLKAFSTRIVDKKAEKIRKQKLRKKNSEESKRLLKNVKEIYLSKEDQIAEVLERAKSLNYLNSPYKCDLCYKGFVDARAFQNHKEKHDESSGAHACDVCRLRYRSARLLRAHALTSHARRYACGACAHTSHTANQAREHERWHNGQTYECQLCGHTYRKPTSFLTHMRKCHPTEHVCAECGLSFVGRHGLLMHRSKVHRGLENNVPEKTSETSLCAACDVRFKSLDAWQRHILTSVKHAVGNGDTVTCLSCGSAIRSWLLRAHVREHVREHAREHARPPLDPRLQLPCEQCGARFANRSKLQAHVNRVHLGLKYNKHMVCEICGKHCTSNATLRYHQRTHSGERPFGCTSRGCGKRFADRNQLRVHARVHSGERPYRCPRCPKRFSQRPALNRHVRIHTGAKPYACQLCPKTFSQSYSLKLHVGAVHLKLPHNRRRRAADTTQPAAEP